MLPQLILLRYSKDNDFTVKLNDTKMVGVEVDAYIPELNTVFTVIDRSTKSTSNIQMVIEHICRRSKIKYVKLDTRKVPEEVCNDIREPISVTKSVGKTNARRYLLGWPA